ncbi:MAG: hypothetical protein ABFS86_10260 [Planctomycetota bacterium]
MGRKVGAIVWVGVLVLVLSGTARAGGDVVILDTGMVLEGKILSRNEKALRMDVDGLGKMDVPMNTVKTINGKSPQPVEKPAEPENPDPAEEPETPTEPEKPVARTDVPYDDMKTGMTLLFILAGEDHGDWLATGDRVVAELGTVGKRRFKLILDPAAGVMGEKWVKREDLLRAIDLDGHAERRLLFFSEGVESGSWVHGATTLGDTFEGQLGGVSKNGMVMLAKPDGDRVEELAVDIAEIKSLRAVTRSKDLSARIEGLAAGEPVEFTVRGRDGKIAGFVVRSNDQWLSVSDGRTRTHVFRGLPITRVRTLPAYVRRGLAGVMMGDWLTINVLTEDDEAVTRRSVTGRYHSATLSGITLETTDGAEVVPVAKIETVAAPDAERLPALTARKETSSAETVLPVLPGMTREEVERRIPVGMGGIDIVWEDDRVATVYVRPPYPGPVFGIRFDDALGKALTRTDLVFDTQITPKDDAEVVTMVSHTLTTLEVRLLVSKGGTILAAEVSAK